MTPLPADVRLLLRRVLRARAWEQAQLWGARGTLLAAGAAIGWALLGTIVPVAYPPLLVLVGGIGVAVLVTLARGVVPGGNLATAARFADMDLRLQERISTAVDLTSGRIPPTALGERLLRDAALRARAAMPAARLHRAPPGVARWTLAAVTVAVLTALYVPGFTLPATPARQTTARIQQEGRRLEQVARRLEQTARTERAPAARRAAPEVRALGQGLQRDRLDRSAALARIAALERQLEEARRQLGERIGRALNAQSPATVPESLFRPSAELDRSVRQLRDLAARLGQPEGVGQQQDLLERLAGLSRAGEGQVPAEAQRHLDEARRKAEAGDTGGARRSLSAAIQEMDALRAIMSDDSALQMTERELERSSMRIARGATQPGTGEVERGEAESAPPGSADRRLREQEGESVEALPPPPGPNEGSTPGRGRPPEKLGAETPRLEPSQQQRTRVPGQEGPGTLQTTELLGPGRSRAAREPLVDVPPAVVRRADEHMARARIPAGLRGVVRRYFELLASRR